MNLNSFKNLNNQTMILDKLENAELYSCISENLKKGFDFLTTTDLSKLEVGRFEIDGKNVFALISEYESKAHQDCRLEAHQAYADIQYIVSGREAIGFAPLSGQTVTEEYISEKDIVFFSGDTTQLILEKGMFAVFFPQDVHRPSMQIDGPEKVTKVVVKVKL
jgi:YhcH/YjgK/YiaL family protein